MWNAVSRALALRAPPSYRRLSDLTDVPRTRVLHTRNNITVYCPYALRGRRTRSGGGRVDDEEEEEEVEKSYARVGGRGEKM